MKVYIKTQFGSHQSGPTGMTHRYQVKLSKFNTHFLGVKIMTANRNYLIRKILGWPKGAPFFERLINWSRMVGGYSQLRLAWILEGNRIFSCEYFIN